VDEFSPAILSIITNVYYQNPSVDVQSKNPQADGLVKPQLMYILQHPDFVPFRLTDLLKSSLKYGMDHSGMKEEMQLACFDLLVAGFACVEMNHEAKPSEESQTPDDVLGPEDRDSMPEKIGGALSDMMGTIKDKVSHFIN